MINAILGLPGPLTNWCREVVTLLLEATGADVDKSHMGGTLEELGERVLTSQAEHHVFSVCRPDKGLAAVLRKTQKPILFAVSDPRRATLHLINGSKLDPLTAIRTLSGDCSCLVTMVGHNNLIPITFDAVLTNPFGEASRIAQAYSLTPSQKVLEAIVERCIPIHQSMTEAENGGTIPSEILKTTLSAEDIRAVEFLLGGLERQIYGQTDAPLIATKELFLNGDAPHDPVNAPLDMTGRSKYVVFGPFIHIPPGAWMLRFIMSFSEEAIGIPCVVDVGATDKLGFRELTRTHVIISTAGRMDVSLAFQLEDPLASLQVRLMTEKPVFDGRMAVGFAEFRRKTSQDHEDPATLLPNPG